MNINELVNKAHNNAVKKGFYDCPICRVQSPHSGEESRTCVCGGTGKSQKNIGELLMLVVSELGEALEAHRKNTFPLYEMFQSEIDEGFSFQVVFENHIKDTLHDELADAVIRICDMCGYLNIDLEKHIELKMKYNESREYKHGKQY